MLTVLAFVPFHLTVKAYPSVALLPPTARQVLQPAAIENSNQAAEIEGRAVIRRHWRLRQLAAPLDRHTTQSPPPASPSDAH